MNSTSLRSDPANRQIALLGVLSLVMMMTRFHHEGSVFSLPDASLAIFFLAGIFLEGPLSYWVLLILAAAVDYIAITALSVNSYCISPAYLFLAPTYAALWFGGRFIKQTHHHSLMHYAALLALTVVFSTSIAFLISNGSFYWFSGKVSGIGIVDYALELAREFGPYVGATLFYVLAGLGVNALVRSLAIIRLSRVDSL